MKNKTTILKVALLGLCIAVPSRTAFAGKTNVTAKQISAVRTVVVAAAQPKAQRLNRLIVRQISSDVFSTHLAPYNGKGITRFSDADDSLGRHFSRFSGPLGPTLTVPGATFVRGPLTPAQLGQLFSESVEISEGEVLYEFPPGTAIRKVVATQPARKN